MGIENVSLVELWMPDYDGAVKEVKISKLKRID